ncbi:Aa_trans domain-containing protein [Meloidogyne graminicola]|uniref:Aa_trans domain-containing protein n=1 Tax=Meloidogyne graminicola TaxID=189291 RepID=A0A8S9ZRE8_9BILA|nr:Aa_trans domain-containing protein [Meloidogyne graminicola]
MLQLFHFKWVSVVYFMYFVLSMLKNFMKNFFLLFLFKPTQVQWMLLIFPPFLIINFLRSIKSISIISTIGNILCFISFGYIFQYLIRIENKTIKLLPGITDFEGVMAACGSILYSFEGQAMVLPLENKLKKPSQMVGIFGILSIGLFFVSLVLAMSGFLGFIAFGQNVRGSITLNLPQNNIQFSILRLALTIVIYLGFVIQMYVIVDMFWPLLCKKLEKKRRNIFNNFKLFIELGLRTFLIIITTIVVPNLEEIIPLVGVTTGMLLAFLIPSLLDILTWLPIRIKRKEYKLAIILLIEDVIMALIGIFGLIAGLQANLIKIFN